MTAPVTGPEDEAWMAEAIALGRGVRADTSPNPWVGAVVVPDGDQPAAEGATQPPGGPHAEVVALELAGAAARNATVYVTLEPCAHHGRTPPCADALIAAGVRRVVVGVLDPDPQVSGRGVQRLREAGIEVEVGVAAAEVTASLRPYLAHRRRGRPWVVLKLAATLDGRIAAPDGSSRWITGPAARLDAHQLRAESDAILVGAGTVRADDPALTVRDVAGSGSPSRRPRPAARGRPGAPGAGARWGPRAAAGRPRSRAAWSSCWWRAGRAWRRPFTGAAWSTSTSSTWPRPCSAATTGCRSSPGPGAPTLAEAWRGRIADLRRLGPDLRIDLLAGDVEGAVP